MSGIVSTDPQGLRPPSAITVVPESRIVNGTIVGEMIAGETVSKITVGLTDVLNQAGSGILQFAALTSGVAPLTASELKITLDGVVVYDRNAAIVSANAGVFPAGVITSLGGIDGGSLSNMPVFNSIRIEYASDGTNTGYAHWRYYLT